MNLRVTELLELSLYNFKARNLIYDGDSASYITFYNPDILIQSLNIKHVLLNLYRTLFLYSR